MRLFVLLVASALVAGCAMPGSDDDTDPTPTPTPASPTPASPTPASPTPASPTPSPTPASPTPASPTPASPTPPTPTPPPPPVAISIQNIAQGYDPATVTVPVGTNVTWTNNDPALPHTATANDGSFDTGNLAAGGGTGSFVFTTAGTFAYHCALHPTMTASITVQ